MDEWYEKHIKEIEEGWWVAFDEAGLELGTFPTKEEAVKEIIKYAEYLNE